MLDYKDMPIEHIVVDGSNIATEGRSLPSLAQLEEAVAELRRDHPDAEITVIVDATFAHRIDPSELARFEQAAMRGEYVHPPAGAIGQGDAFLLRVAEKVDATVLSNDSFQEFHGEHPWLFERGRLLGATPVPGIGWIFSPRQPVRGPRSHQAVRETEQAKKRVTKAIAVATKEVVKPAGKLLGATSSGDGSRRRGRGAGQAPAGATSSGRDREKPTPLAVNDPLAFISFIAEHRLGELLEGEVEGYTSHGAVVRVGEMRCYVPLANLADPAPRSAREVLKRGEHGEFVLTALDPQRRGAELALPGIARVSGHPREETVAAEVRLAKPPRKRGETAVASVAEPAKKPGTKKAAAEQTSGKAEGVKRRPAKAVPEKPTVARAASSRATAKKKSASSSEPPTAKATAARAARTRPVASKGPVTKPTAAKESARRVPAKKAAALVVPAKQQAAKKAAPEKARAAKTATAKATGTKTTGTKTAGTRQPGVRVTAKRVGAGETPAAKAIPAGKAASGRPSGAKVLRTSAVSGQRAKKLVATAVSEKESVVTPKGRRSPRATAATR